MGSSVQRVLFALTLGVVLSGDGLLAQKRSDPFPTARGSVHDQNGKPLDHIWVGSRYFGDGTDSSGHFSVWVDTLPDTLTITERGYLSIARPVVFRDGKARSIDFILVPAPEPCCALNGRWSGRFTLKKPGALGPVPADTVVSGELEFADSFPNLWPRRGERAQERVRELFGRSSINFTPFFGSQVAKDVSSTTFGRVDDSFYREVQSAVFNADSVDIDFIPRISHGGISLKGRIAGDSIVGIWWQRAYCCGATGRFVLRRAN